MIFIDSREKGQSRKAATEFLAKKNIETDVRVLNTGDYWITCDNGKVVCIERKKVSDLFASIKNDSLIKQMATCLEHFDYVRLMIHGQIFKPVPNGAYFPPDLAISSQPKFDYYSIDVRRVIGTLSTVQTAGVIVDHWPLPGQLGAYLYHLKQAYEKGWHESEIVKPRMTSFKRPTRFEDALTVLKIPTLGKRGVEKAAAHFSSLAEVCQAELDDLNNKLGVRHGTAIYNYLHNAEHG